MLNKKENPNEWNRIRKGDHYRKTFQKTRALSLIKDAGLKNHSGPCGNNELNKLQQAMDGYQIKVFSKNLYASLMFQGKNIIYS